MANYNNVMIDIETLDTTPTAKLVSIGAVHFCTESFKVHKKHRFFRCLDVDWGQENRTVSQSTLDFWDKQPENIRSQLNGLDDIKDVLNDLSVFCEGLKPWGNGATFDITILEHAYVENDMKPPWRFWNIRDCRTVCELFERARGGLNSSAKRANNHNAIDDAVNQAEYICEAYKYLLRER